MEAIEDVANTGRHVLLIGLIAQTISYLFFAVLVVNSHLRLSRDKSLDKSEYPWFLFGVVYFSSVFILVRKISMPEET